MPIENLGLSRQPSSDWLQGVMVNCEHFFGVGLELDMSGVRGVGYLAASSIHKIRNPRIRQSIEQDPDAYLESLRDTNAVSPGLLEPVTLAVRQIRLESLRNRNNMRRLTFILDDEKSAEFPNGYRVLGEKRQLAQSVGLPLKPYVAAESVIPKLYMKAVDVIGYSDHLAESLPAEFIEACTSRVTLGPVGTYQS